MHILGHACRLTQTQHFSRCVCGKSNSSVAAGAFAAEARCPSRMPPRCSTGALWTHLPERQIFLDAEEPRIHGPGSGLDLSRDLPWHTYTAGFQAEFSFLVPSRPSITHSWHSGTFQRSHSPICIATRVHKSLQIER